MGRDLMGASVMLLFLVRTSLAAMMTSIAKPLGVGWVGVLLAQRGPGLGWALPAEEVGLTGLGRSLLGLKKSRRVLWQSWAV